MLLMSVMIVCFLVVNPDNHGIAAGYNMENSWADAIHSSRQHRQAMAIPPLTCGVAPVT